jgi:hypothetical protein
LCLIRHGPFAYVFSLTNWEARKFTGGETFIMNAPVLDYWRQALYYCFTAALLLLYYCFTTALLLLYYCLHLDY